MMNSTVFSGVKVTLFGHASVLLEADGLAIYVDPFVLPKGAKPADVILYTHGHFDHCTAAPSITTNNTVAIGHGCKLPVRVIEIGGKEKVGGVVIEAVDAYNTNKPYHPKGAGAGYLIQFKTACVYVAGDTDFIPEMKGYDCDIALLPIGGKYTMDANEAMDAVDAIKPKVVIPYHYNYLDETHASPEEFRRLVMEKLGGKVDIRILTP
jgi:L-ascorbate metabolism protein UlaG (beta-lactamase superfamily)